eukprot:CAMPEP_0198727208 /NCGR_PEP_ID=MMETSP1475-20131203/4006_1 /TAXON_ID= ORGANISM="Unidentified sp., Strain CCMP1999" /NCGR_SAMPLE_ID=MMETSP1475 /ASSEMBLY_ACC=CAM_ASM_001111 /LENGTH=1060 /DNA_ID=CAMNT_0044489217 /DNA_START=46 /DNA_END=3229 /DNA_ORIENTATION=-
MEEARAGVPHRGMCTRCVRIGDNGELVRAVSAAKDSPTAAPTSHEGPRTHLSLGSTDKKGPSVGKHAGNNSAELCEQRRLPGLLDKSEICPRAQTLAQEKKSRLVFAWRMFNIALNFIAIVGWAQGVRYLAVQFPWRVINVILGSFFLLDQIGAMFATPVKYLSKTILQRDRLANSISAPSLILSGTGFAAFINFNFLRVYNLYNEIRLIFYGNKDPDKGKPEGNQTTYVILWLLQLYSLVFLTTGIIYSLEAMATLTNTVQSTGPEGDKVWNMVTAVYFIFVTTSTVGYGDMTPSTILSSTYIIIALVVAVYVVGGQLSNIVEAFSSHRFGDSPYRPSMFRRKGHVLVIGNHKASDFACFLATYFSDATEDDTSVVMLGPYLQWRELDWERIMANSDYNHRVMFIRGAPTSKLDLKRAALDAAEVVFSISNAEGDDALSEDAASTIGLVTLRQMYPDVPLFASCALVDSFRHVADSISRLRDKNTEDESSNWELLARKLNRFVRKGNIRLDFQLDDMSFRENIARTCDPRTGLVCSDQIIAKLATINVRFPGAATLLSNLIMETTIEPADVDTKWKREYADGTSNSFFLMGIPSQVSPYKFAALAEALHHQYSVILVALISKDRVLSGKGSVSVADVDQDVLDSHYGLVIGNSRHVLAAEADASDEFAKKLTSCQNANALRKKENIIDETPDNEADREPAPPGEEKHNHIVVVVHDDRGMVRLQVVLKSLLFERGLADATPAVAILAPESVSDVLLPKLQKLWRAPVTLTRGNSTDERALYAVGLHNAKSVVVFSNEADGESLHDEQCSFRSPRFETADIKPVLSLLTIEQFMSRINRSLYLTGQLRDVESLVYLRYLVRVPSDARHGDPITWSANKNYSYKIPLEQLVQGESKSYSAEENDLLPYLRQTRQVNSSGSLLVSCVSSALICREYQIPGIINVFTELLSKDHLLGLINTPDALAGKSFQDIFVQLLALGGIACGLYRSGYSASAGEPDSQEFKGDEKEPINCWVYTNPAKDTVVSARDGIYVMTMNLVDFQKQLRGEFGECEVQTTSEEVS